MNKNVSVRDITPVIEQLINDGSDINITVTGTSMFPMLRSREDSVVITKAPGVLKKYDLPLYKRDNGEYILHRIIKRKPDCYFMNGDNQYFVEKGITQNQIVGIVKGFYRKGKYFEVTHTGYRIYCRFWVAIRPFRGVVSRIYKETVIKYKRRKK